MPFVIPTIKTCCCGCSLETGSKIIGYIYLIFWMLLFALGVLIAVSKGAFDFFFEITADMTFMSQVLFSILLLYGINKSNPCFILPWVLLQTVFMIFLTICVVFYLMIFVFGTHVYHLTYDFLQLVLHGYTVLVVFNFYRELKNNPRRAPDSIS